MSFPAEDDDDDDADIAAVADEGLLQGGWGLLAGEAARMRNEDEAICDAMRLLLAREHGDFE